MYKYKCNVMWKICNKGKYKGEVLELWNGKIFLCGCFKIILMFWIKVYCFDKLCIDCLDIDDG